MKAHWTVRLSAAAESDFQQILRWTVENFGRGQARTYAKTLIAAIDDLAQGPSVTGARLREEIGAGIRVLHVARKGRKGRHFVLFMVSDTDGGKTIDVLRLLHDSMDLQRHIFPALESEPPADPPDSPQSPH